MAVELSNAFYFFTNLWSIMFYFHLQALKAPKSQIDAINELWSRFCFLSDVSKRKLKISIMIGRNCITIIFSSIAPLFALESWISIIFSYSLLTCVVRCEMLQMIINSNIKPFKCVCCAVKINETFQTCLESRFFKQNQHVP